MTQNSKFYFIASLLMLVTIGAGVVTYTHKTPQTQPPAGSTIAYAVPKVSTSTQLSITNSATVIIATSSNCVARIISTGQSAIMLSFGGLLSVSGTAGHWQAASTTVAYSNGDYGCGQIQAYSYAASLITATQLTQ